MSEQAKALADDLRLIFTDEESCLSDGARLVISRAIGFTDRVASCAASSEWKRTPKDATQEMLDAAAATPGIQAIDAAASVHQLRGYPCDTAAFADGSPLQQAWRAMWAAAPQSAADQVAAAELRRLHEVNAELLEALQLVRMSAGWQHLSGESKAVIDSAIRRALGQ